MSVAEGYDLLFQTDLQPLERHVGGGRKFEFEIVQSAGEQRPIAKLPDQVVDGVVGTCNGAIDALVGQQHRAFDIEAGADIAQRCP